MTLTTSFPCYKNSKEHQQSNGRLPLCLFLAQHACSTPAIAAPDKWTMAIMQSMLNERPNSQKQREREREREGETDRQTDRQTERKEVIRRLYPAQWCGSASHTWLVWRGREGPGCSRAYLNDNTPTPPTPSLHLTQPHSPPSPRLGVVGHDKAPSEETSDDRG